MKSYFMVASALVYFMLIAKAQEVSTVNNTVTETDEAANTTTSISETLDNDDIIVPCNDSNTNKTNSTVGDSCGPPETKEKEYLAGKESEGFDDVAIIVVPIFFIVGVCGNAMTIAIMRSQQFRHMTSSLILISLALSDTIFLTTMPFNRTFLRNLMGIDVRSISDAGCKIFFLVFRVSKMASSWFVVMVCFERFVAVWFPLKTKLICTRRNTFIGIACVYIGMFVLNGYWTISTRLVDGKCIPNAFVTGAEHRTAILLLTGITVYSVIPTIILMILTPAICFKLFQQAGIRRNMSSKHDDKSDETAKTTAMLLGVTFAFIILVTPISWAHLASFFMGENVFESNAPGIPELREIGQILEQLNYCINFFMYVLCSRSFRQKVAQFLGLRMCQRAVKKANKSSSDLKTVSSQLA